MAAFILSGLLLLGLVTVVLLAWLTQRQRQWKKPTPLRTRPSGPTYYATPRTRAKLLELVGGDRQVLMRLVAKVYADHPLQCEQWCYEKAISDLKLARKKRQPATLRTKKTDC